jgi:hypothetical protein
MKKFLMLFYGMGLILKTFVPSYGIVEKIFIPWDDFFRPIQSHAEPYFSFSLSQKVMKEKKQTIG